MTSPTLLTVRSSTE